MNLEKSYEYFNPDNCKEDIHIVGCGSVGATLAENLARLGLTRFTLWDFDEVEPHNIANQIFTQDDIGRKKIDALKDILLEINPEIEQDIKLKYEGWDGQNMSGFVFLAVDNIELRKRIVEQHRINPNVVAMFDFRTGLTDAQHYAADWAYPEQVNNLLATMDFTHEEAMEATPVSACNTTLSVCPTIRIIVAYGVANFMNYWRGEPLKKMILIDAFNFMLDAF